MSEFALITGASSGIGLELAKVFASNGVGVIITARSQPKLEQLKNTLESEYGVSVIVIVSDLSKPNSPQEVYDEVTRQDIKINYLVNNAGFCDFGEFSQTNWEKEAMMIDLNIKSLTHLTKLFLSHLLEGQTGKIMNVASTAAFQPGPLMAVYYATKAYVLFFSEAIANELAESDVTVTTLCPGPTESGFQAAADLETSRLFKVRKIPSSKQVAEYGYKAMMQGKTVAVHGKLNWLLANSIRFMPRQLVIRMVRRVQSES